jgi:hypothetical protein
MLKLYIIIAVFIMYSYMRGVTIKNNHKIAAMVIAALVFSLSAGASVSADSSSGWIAMTSGTTADLCGVWGTGSDIFATGESGTIIHYNGSDCVAMTSGTTADLYGVWGAGGSDVFAVGKSGTIMHYNGTGWAAMASGTTAELYGVWGAGSSDIYAVGGSGTVIHYNGTGWAAMASGTTAELYGVWGAGSSDIYAVGGSGTVIHYNGTGWAAMDSGTAADLYGVWGTDNTHVFVAGQSGVILNYNGFGFSSMNRNTAKDLSSVWGLSDCNIFISGSSGTILRYFPPSIYEISPDEGHQSETLNLTITGNNFTGTTAVQFGVGISVNSFNVLNSNQIDASITIVYNAVAGLRDVSVTTPWGSFTFADGFTVKPALPVITLISPDSGNQGTMLNVTITGDNFTGATAVQFGAGISVNSFSVLSSNQIAASITIAADAAVGARDISVTNAGGSFTLPSGFTIKQALPVITSVEPNHDRQGSTLNVTIIGSNFSGANEVQFGAGISVNSFNVLSSNQIAANITIAADAVVGTRDVSVTTPGGSFTLSDGFTVKWALPVITSVEPSQERQGATLNVTITGNNFTGATAVQFGDGISINSFTILSSNQIAANITIAADATTGARDVLVTNQGGSHTLTGGFTVKQALPVITSISPACGNQGVTLAVVINGNNLSGANSVNFGEGVAITEFSNISPMQLLVNVTIASDATIGTRDIMVTTPGGSFTLAGGFTIKQKLPEIISLNLDSGNRGATLNIIITGNNFTGASAVQFGDDISVNSFTVLNANQITASITIMSTAAAGTRDVSVTTPGGSFTLTGGFTVKQALPVITSINPDSGNPGTTLAVIINGSNLDGATSVSFGDGIEVTGFSNISSTQLRVNLAISSDAVIGSRDVLVTTPGGSTTLGKSFNIEVKSQNTIALVSIWTGIVILFILLTVILNILRQKRASRL